MILTGEVVHGRGVGRTMGFPTANLRCDLPEGVRLGVYAAWIDAEGGRYGCVLNIGRRPTFPGDGISVEANLIGFSGDLYGQNVRIETVRFLREEIRFANADELARQIASDCETAAQVLHIDIAPFQKRIDKGRSPAIE